jgi:ElaB/YqjD/DUF883 family membrane-anchored ribosome-binding protein
MLESNIEIVKKDLHTLVKDAQELFQAATLLTGEKADELRNRGMRLLDAAQEKAQRVQAVAMQTGREIVHTTDDFVQDNPWQAIGVAAGAGLLLGLLIGRR